MKISLKKIFKVCVFLCIGGVIFGSALVYGTYHWASQNLPDFTDITDYNPPLVTTVYTRDKEVLGYFYKERRFLVRKESLPDHVWQAFVAAEDGDFFEHQGIDFTAIIRAMVNNLRAGHIVGGGSTITQQVVKMLILTPEKNYHRKMQEAILAYRLERHLSKDEILTIYLNQAFFGNRAYGIEAAARTYFGVHAKDLSIAQAALIAGVLPAPSKYNPFQNLSAAVSRQHYVLEQLRAQALISSKDYSDAMKEELNLKSMEEPSWKTGAYYLEEVRRRLIEKYGEDQVYNAGLHVFTAIDLKHQKAAEKALRKGLEASAMRRGWPGAETKIKTKQWEEYLKKHPVEPKDLKKGEWVQVLVTGVKPKFATVRLGELKGEIAVETMAWARKPDIKTDSRWVKPVKDATLVVRPGDVIWAEIIEVPKKLKELLSQAGESSGLDKKKVAAAGSLALGLRIKPKVQGALVSMDPKNGDVLALVGGYSFAKSQFNRATQAFRQPGSAFKPIVYSCAIDNDFTAASIVLDAPIVYKNSASGQVWKPQNVGGKYYGPTLLRTALVKSRNLVTIRVAQRVGIEKIVSRARALGLVGEFPLDLSVSLGSVAVTPLNLTEAYTVFPGGGSYAKSRFILQVKDAWGKELFVGEPELTAAISPQTAYIMTSLMKDVVQSGTGFRAKALKRPVAGKTGTTNDEFDAWFVGFTPHLVSAVYVGFDQLAPMGRSEGGSIAASPIWVDYRMAVKDDYSPDDFTRPEDIVMARVDGKNGLLAGRSSAQSYFLPFVAGTEPLQTSGSQAASGGAEDNDLLKKLY